MDRIQARDNRIFNAPPDRILPILLDVSKFHAWWPASIQFSVLKESPGGVGSEVEIKPFGANSFCCRIESMDPSRIVMRYFKGIYSGEGIWTLTTVPNGTDVSYAVNLEITSMTVRMLAKMVDVKALHSKLMNDVFDGLQRMLNTPPVS